jgi:transposase
VRSVVACGLDGQTGELFERRLTPDHAAIIGWVRSLPTPVAVTYEAGPTGFGLARFLTRQGVPCLVAAPSKLQRPSGDRVKTDVRDARHLARLLHLGEIVAVAVPSVEQETARDLVRAREDVRRDLMSARHRLSKLLLRHGSVYCGGKPWTASHDLWLCAQRRSTTFSARGLRCAFDTAYDTMLATVARRDRLDIAITEMAADSEFTPVATRVGCLRGVSTLTAFGLAVEIGDWSRLTGRTIGAYLGLVPTESSSGTTRSQGGITKTGNSHARRLLIEAAWHHRPRYRPGAELRRRQNAASPAARPWRAGQPPTAHPLDRPRLPAQAAGRSQHRDRPRARRLVLVTGRPRGVTELHPALSRGRPGCSRRGSVSTSFVLAALLHVDTSATTGT